MKDMIYKLRTSAKMSQQRFKDLFFDVSRLPKDEIKKKLGDVLFEIVCNAETKEGYQYKEPSALAEIKALRKEYILSYKTDIGNIESKIYGAWMGRICGEKEVFAKVMRNNKNA